MLHQTLVVVEVLKEVAKLVLEVLKEVAKEGWYARKVLNEV